MPNIPHFLKVAAALIVLYSSWGSSYIANHFAIADMPPFLMTSARMLISARLMWGISILQHDTTRPGLRDLWRHFIVACPMIVFGSGFLAKSQETVSSSTAADRRSFHFKLGMAIHDFMKIIKKDRGSLWEIV